MNESQTQSEAISFPYEIVFADSDPSPTTRELIESYLADLDDRYKRISSGKVFVRIPHPARGQRFFHVHIQLDVPGKHLVVSREPESNSNHSDITSAVKDAFDKMERQLKSFLDHKRDRH